jgi:CcmD family protein
MNYLYAAYIATWLIHLGYLGTLLRRYARLKKETEELKSRITT